MSNSKKEIFIFIFILTCILIAFCVIYCRFYKTEGTSMEPTIQEGNRLLMIKNRTINRGDIIVFHTESKDAIKRVIAIPGDKVEITEKGIVIVNGEELKEKYIKGTTDPGEQTYPLTIKEGCYFVLGDNRDDSLDSRFLSIDTIKEDEIIGKVVASIYPPKIL